MSALGSGPFGAPLLPAAWDMPHSHHSHSGQFCAHAQGSLESVVQEAIAQGFVLYGLSEHCPRSRSEDLYPEEVEAGLTPNALSRKFDAFVEEAWKLKAEYAGKIEMLVGLETEVIHDEEDLDALEDLLQRHGRQLEYVVGSVHHAHGIPIDFDHPTYSRALSACSPSSTSTPLEAQAAFLDAYFDAQHLVITRLQPEIIGHIDLCRLYEPSLSLESFPSAWAKLERNVYTGIAYGALFECNAAALRKSWPSSYPGVDVLRLILSLGGRVALSDDSHGPHAVGLNYGRMKEYLRREGVQEVWRLQIADEPNEKGRWVKAIKVDRWWEDAFWEKEVRSQRNT